MIQALRLREWRDTFHSRPCAISINILLDGWIATSLLGTIYQQIHPSYLSGSEQLMETMPWISVECALTMEQNGTEQNSTSSLCYFHNSGSTDLCKWSLFCITLSSNCLRIFFGAYLARAPMFCMGNEQNFSSLMRTIVWTPSLTNIRIAFSVLCLLGQLQNAGTSWELITRSRSRRSSNGI